MDQRPQVSFDELVNNRQLFNQYVYTPLLDAVEILNTRWENIQLKNKVAKYLHDDVPPIFKEGFKAILFRSLATPNYELRRFMCIPDALGLQAVFLEIHDDKFSLNNSLKYQLARLSFHMGHGKKGGSKIVYKKIIDFNGSHKKNIREVQTLWQQSLIDFHHELFELAFPEYKSSLFDVSKWLHNGGRKAKQYYLEVIALLVRHGILFENFVIEGEEKEFIRDVFLPAFSEVWDVAGVKPLIVALEPTEMEDNIFWLSYPPNTLAIVESKELTINNAR